MQIAKSKNYKITHLGSHPQLLLIHVSLDSGSKFKCTNRQQEGVQEHPDASSASQLTYSFPSRCEEAIMKPVRPSHSGSPSHGGGKEYLPLANEKHNLAKALF